MINIIDKPIKYQKIWIISSNFSTCSKNSTNQAILTNTRKRKSLDNELGHKFTQTLLLPSFIFILGAHYTHHIKLY